VNDASFEYALLIYPQANRNEVGQQIILQDLAEIIAFWY
jgi:hypothetical protein